MNKINSYKVYLFLKSEIYYYCTYLCILYKYIYINFVAFWITNFGRIYKVKDDLNSRNINNELITN